MQWPHDGVDSQGAKFWRQIPISCAIWRQKRGEDAQTIDAKFFNDELHKVWRDGVERGEKFGGGAKFKI